MANFPAGYEDLSWVTLDSGLSVSAASRTSFLGTSADLLNVTYSLVAQKLAMQFFTISSATAGDELKIAVSWSYNNTLWKDVANGASLNVIDVFTMPMGDSEVFVVPVKARYFRFDLEGVGTGPITVSTRYAPIFASTYQA